MNDNMMLNLQIQQCCCNLHIESQWVPINNQFCSLEKQSNKTFSFAVELERMMFKSNPIRVYIQKDIDEIERKYKKTMDLLRKLEGMRHEAQIYRRCFNF